MTAEERLLQVIENGETPLKRNDSGRLPRWLRRFYLSFDLSSVNRVLILLIVVGFIGIAANFLFFKPDIQLIYNRVAQASTAPSRPATVAPQRPVDEYLNTINLRDLFQPALVSAAGLAAGTPVLAKSSIEEALGNLELVGIAWGAYPEAMLKDKKGGRTHFVKEGDTLGKVKVKEIQQDRVVVEFGGQTKELM
ncbi:MAG: hypothetical protein HYY44_06760 [Deltaproteobacteria bacterium]|nr:hypothetical protein [Deltaproteobacteria bacterium]